MKHVAHKSLGCNVFVLFGFFAPAHHQVSALKEEAAAAEEARSTMSEAEVSGTRLLTDLET